MNSTLRVGQKVVCINAIPKVGNRWGLDGLTRGVIYTLQSVFIDELTGDLNVHLAEIKRPVRSEIGDDYYGVSGFDSARFRPLITKTLEEDVSIFREVANNIDTDLVLSYIEEALNG